MQKYRRLLCHIGLVYSIVPGVLATNKAPIKQKNIITRIIAKYKNVYKRYKKYRAYQCTPQEEQQLEQELMILRNIVLAIGGTITATTGCFIWYKNMQVPQEEKKIKPDKPTIPDTPKPNPPIPPQEKELPIEKPKPQDPLPVPNQIITPPLPEKVTALQPSSSQPLPMPVKKDQPIDIKKELNAIVDKGVDKGKEIVDKSKQKLSEVKNRLGKFWTDLNT